MFFGRRKQELFSYGLALVKHHCLLAHEEGVELAALIGVVGTSFGQAHGKKEFLAAAQLYNKGVYYYKLVI